MAIKISSAHYGWVSRVVRSGEGVVNVEWTLRRDCAKPFREWSKELELADNHLKDKGISHDLVREYMPWIDREGAI